uniref:Proteasome 20S subunit beta 6 n=1 Tax=Neogobius melanostomus TaxID=47308 RepID=A0A8C6T433_9GOBI
MRLKAAKANVSFRRINFRKHTDPVINTTIMAVEYDGGVVIGADSRTTTGVTDKLTPIHERIFCCRSDSEPAAALYLLRAVPKEGPHVTDLPPLPQVYCVPIGGMLVRQPVSVGGSGSTYIYGFMDSNYKPNMTKEQCLELTASALTLAMERDGSSGGVVRLASISESGVERRVILGNQLPKIVSTH